MGAVTTAAVDQAGVAGEADQAAPGARADQLAHFRVAEEPREAVAAGAGEAVDQHALRSLMGDRWPGPVGAVAPRLVVGDRAIEQLDEAVRDLPAAVPALVDDQRLLAHLADELPHKIVLAVDARVRHVDIADAAAGLLRRRRRGSSRSRRDSGYCARCSASRTVTSRALLSSFGLSLDRDGDYTVRQGRQTRAHGSCEHRRRAIDGQQVVAHFDLHARLAPADRARRCPRARPSRSA